MKTTLYRHQKFNLSFHLQRHKSADWSDCGTGKSLTALAKFEYLKNLHQAQTLLIVCPLSVMVAWEDEISKHTDYTSMKLLGSVKDKVAKLQSSDPIFIVTYDSIAGREENVNLFKALVKKKFDMVILDEATHLKNWEAKRTRALTSLCDSIKYGLALSGTFLPQHIEDTLTIYRAMDGGETFGDIFKAKKYYFENVGTSFPQWVLREDKTKEFMDNLWVNAVRTKKEDCTDLPPKVWKHYYCDMTEAQAEAYKEIQTNLRVRYVNNIIFNTRGGFSEIFTLKQVASGFLYGDAPSASDYNGLRPSYDFGSRKIDLLKEVIEQIGAEKAVIYCHYLHELEKVKQTLPNSAILYGGLSQTERADQLDKFEQVDCQFLIAQIHTGGYGLTLTQANHVIYYSLPFSLIEFLQSQDRIHRIGQDKTCIYHILLTKGTIEPKIYKALSKKIEVTQFLVAEEGRIIKFIGDDENL